VDFDVVVIGAGSAGCAVTGAVAADGRQSVCLIEAGPDYGAREGGRWPSELLDPRRRPRTHDWSFEAEADGGLVPEARAKVVGGCSAHNQCAIVRPAPEDCVGWGWEAGELEEIMREVQQRVPTASYPDKELAFWQRAFLEAAVAAGVPRVVDVGDPAGPDGVAPFHANVRDGVRFNAAFAFLDPVRGRPNVTVMAETLADRLEIEGERAVALRCVRGDRELEVRARRFVLCAGTYGSPAVLLRSGVGPRPHLDELQIPVRLARAGVGLNLHDHPGVGLTYEPSAAARAALAAELAEGRLFQSQVILRARSGDAAGRADLHLAPYQAPTESGGWSFTLLIFGLAPDSRGRVSLRGRDPHLSPRIEPRLITDRDGRDLATLVAGVRLARRLAREAPLAAAIAGELRPGGGIDSDAGLSEWLRADLTDYAHPVGTCATGPPGDPGAVVDAGGLVHGLANVFVADASVMDQIPRANTNFACFLIGWRAGRRLAHARA
jgi:choline dehydrogenase